MDVQSGSKTWAPVSGSVHVSDYEAVFSDRRCRVDAVIDSAGAITARFKTTPIDGAQIVPLPPDPRVATSQRPSQVNWPTNKSNPELSAAINAQIAAMHKDGTIARTLRKYGLDKSAAQVGEPSLL